MKNKGFTMIELLGVITLLGVLAFISVPEIYKHVKDSRTQAYDTMFKTAYEAAQSKATNTLDEPGDGSAGDPVITYTLKELYEEGYMDAPSDPNKQGVLCSDYSASKVTIKRTNSATADIKTYQYKVHIKCLKYEDERTFTTEG